MIRQHSQKKNKERIILVQNSLDIYSKYIVIKYLIKWGKIVNEMKMAKTFL